MIIILYGFMLCVSVDSDKLSFVNNIRASEHAHTIHYGDGKLYEFLIGGRDDIGKKVMTFWLVFALGQNAILVQTHVDLFTYVADGRILLESDVEFLKNNIHFSSCFFHISSCFFHVSS